VVVALVVSLFRSQLPPRRRRTQKFWKVCFSCSGGSHAESIASLLDRMTAPHKTIDWQERPHRGGVIQPILPRLRLRAGNAVANRGHTSPWLSAPSRQYGRDGRRYQPLSKLPRLV